MRWRLAAAIAILGIAGIPAMSDAVPAHPATAMHVGVKPGTGSPGSQFAVSFRAGVQTGPGSLIRSYRVTAGATKRNGCQSFASEIAPSAAQGSMVHVTLSPGKRTSWCTGTYKGQVWLLQGGAMRAAVGEHRVSSDRDPAPGRRHLQLPRDARLSVPPRTQPVPLPALASGEQWNSSFPTARSWTCPTARPERTQRPRSVPAWPERRSRSRSTVRSAIWPGRSLTPPTAKTAGLRSRS